MLRIAILHKETGALDQSMQDCAQISQEGFSLTIRANALCLKVRTIIKPLIILQLLNLILNLFSILYRDCYMN